MIPIRWLGPDEVSQRTRPTSGPLSSLEEVTPRVREILDSVRTGHDTALRGWNRELDRWDGPIEVAASLRATLAGEVPDDLAAALGFAAERIRTFHERQRPVDTLHRLPGGSELRMVFRPLRRVGIYVPGGRAPYPSTVLMAALAARAAGVREVLLATPPRGGLANGLAPEVAEAARLGRVDRVFLMGGAAAIGALAYGTPTVPRVDKIVGPGNAYVTAAKRAVFGEVGIDSLAGPSECLVVADRSAAPEAIACEVLAQIEHGADSRATVVAVGGGVAEGIADALSGPLADLRSSGGGTIELLRTDDLERAWSFADAMAPESLLVDVADLDRWRADPPCCGALFLGGSSSVAFGDYVVGTNHILPVLGTARFSSGLTVSDFGRWVPIQQVTASDAEALAGPGARIAEAEGMRWHAEAQRARVPKRTMVDRRADAS